MGQGVPVVEHHPATALALVGRHHLRLDRHATGHLLVERQLEQGGVGLGAVKKAYLAISPRPQAHSRGGSVASVSVSHSTAAGCQNAPTRFLPSGRLTPVLPPMAASTWASSEVATFTYAIPRW